MPGNEDRKNKGYFDEAARAWDEKPQRVRLARAVVEALDAVIPLHSRMAAMEYGCGTGLAATALAARLKSITAIDSSAGMLEVLDEKIRRLELKNVSTRLLDLTGDCFLKDRYDLIYTSMTLHHVRPIEKLIRCFRDLLVPGGWLAIADLDLEDGDFHGDVPGVAHTGFDRRELGKILEEKGVHVIKTVTAHTINKECGGVEKAFPVFLMAARKSL